MLVKVNLGCSGSRSPANRLTTHPAVAEAIIEALLDCGARVSFGDDVSRAGQYCDAVYEATGMAEEPTAPERPWLISSPLAQGRSPAVCCFPRAIWLPTPISNRMRW